MKAALTLIALAGSAAAQAVTGLVVPSSTPPAGCSNSRDGTFGLSIVNVTNSDSPADPAPSRRDVLDTRQTSGPLKMTLNGGVLKDQAGRTGYIASNYQFQFDNPPQAGAIYTAGFSICKNGSIAIGGKAIWYQCLSGTFYNLYDRDWAAHCNAVYFEAAGGPGNQFSAAPPGSVSTGPSEATIANGGGTQISNATTTSGASKTSGGSSASATGSSGSGGSSSGGSGSGGAQQTGSSTSTGGAMAMATEASQALFPLAMGIVGALAMI